MRRKQTTVLLAAMLVLTAFAPAAVSAQETSETTIDLTLTQDTATGNATVTVTNGSDVVSGAAVNVTSDVTYAGDGQYTTGADGTVALPNPTHTTELDVTVTSNGTETTETFTVVPVEDSVDVTLGQRDDGTVLLTATQYGDALVGAEVELSSTVAYAGNGTYTTDENGTVDLPEPAETTEVTAVVTTGELETIRTTTVEPIAEFEVAVAANDDGTATVTVTRDDSAVEGANVTVASDVAYAGNGTYTTDANGTVGLPEPAETVNVTVTASDDGEEATAHATLSTVDTGLGVEAVQNDDGTATVTVTDDGTAVENATVNVTSDVAYDGNGTYETTADGTVALPSPDENVTVSVTAINGSEEATATVELETVAFGGYANFGQWLSSFVHHLQNTSGTGPEFGQAVSEFATENNPGAEKRPDHAGPKDDRGPDAEEKPGNGERGPPEHAKQGDEAEDEESEDVDSTDEDCNVEETDDSCEDGESAESEATDDEEEDGGNGRADDSDSNGSDRGNGKSKGHDK